MAPRTIQTAVAHNTILFSADTAHCSVTPEYDARGQWACFVFARNLGFQESTVFRPCSLCTNNPGTLRLSRKHLEAVTVFQPFAA